jgi:hypothetical protein
MISRKIVKQTFPSDLWSSGECLIKSRPATPEREHDYDPSICPAIAGAKSRRSHALAPLLQNLATSRRGLILAPLLAALPATFLADAAHAIDPAQTQVSLPDQYQWKPALPSAPAQSVETVPVFGATDKPGRARIARRKVIKWCKPFSRMFSRVIGGP